MLKKFDIFKVPINEKGNGRINLLNLTDKKFLMQDRMPVKTTSGSYNEALVGILESNNLSLVFFSKENMELIQNRLKQRVAKLTGKNIDSQPVNIIKVIMRNVYLQNSKHISDNITPQISELNDIVVKECLPKLLSGLDSYLKYLNDISNLASPIDRPISTYVSQKLEFTGFFDKKKEKYPKGTGDISKFMINNVEISKNFKTLI